MEGRKTVVLIGAEERENLGLRYLAGQLMRINIDFVIINVAREAEQIVQDVLDLQPVLVGFSVTFQYQTSKLISLVQFLRLNGVTAHFTMGGHYPSFEFVRIIREAKGIDSVVLFEGERALCALAEALFSGKDWRQVPGIAFSNGDEILTNSPFQPILDLDLLADPYREDVDYSIEALPSAPILGSRGCFRHCAFCSIADFYAGNRTKGRRFRSPARIVDEMEYLHRERGVRVLLWQDDDFLSGGRKAVAWSHEIAREAVQRGLHRDLLWKISCRSDELTSEVLEPLIAGGLRHVYLGVEAGDDNDLTVMNKEMSVETHMSAARVLRELGLTFDFGFMLLNPWSTIDTIRNNIRFLRNFAGDGYSVVTFCRMLPYAGTEVERRLHEEKRLSITDHMADYCFLDPRIDLFYEWMLETFTERNLVSNSTVNILRLVSFDMGLDLPERQIDHFKKAAIKNLTAVSNIVALDTLEMALGYIETASELSSDDAFLAALHDHHQAQDKKIRRDIAALT